MYGKDFKLHGKIDPYVFTGNLGEFIHKALKSLVTITSKNNETHQVTKHNYRYRDGKSNMNEKYDYKKKTNEPDLSFATENLNRISTKLNEDWKQYLLNLYAQTDYSKDAIARANAQFVKDINSSEGSRIAFTIGDDIFISDSDNILKGKVISIKDNNGNSITDLQGLVDNFGKAKFNITVSTASGDFEYIAEYKDKKLEITPE
jgi:hypothetical protein